MQGALLILLFTVVVGIVLYLFDLRQRRRRPDESPEDAELPTPVEDNMEEVAQPEEPDEEPHGENGVCCGMHLVCEKDSLSPVSADIIYYDDEELDRFIGRSGNDYTPEEIEEFQEVLITLRPEDVVGWARSITQRRINLPPVVRDELLMLVNERRNIN